MFHDEIRKINRRKYMKKMVLAALLAIVPMSAQAKFSPFLGVYGGYGALRDTESPIQDKDGYLLGGKVIGSWQSSQWYFDAGVGYQYEMLYGDSADVETKEGILELDTRYKLSNTLSLGPVATLHYGTDTHRTEDLDRPDRGMLTGGAKLMYENITNGNPYRIELNLQRSITDIRDGDYYTATLGFQIGFPWDKPKKAITPVLVLPPLTDKKVVVAAAERKPDVQYTLKNSQVGFKTASYKLDPRTVRKLKALGRHLAEHEDQYGEIEISGHTDSRGSFEYNQGLSERRAESVKQVLLDAGVPEGKISSKGYSYSKPIDTDKTPAAFDRNRRTEIQFYGVKNSKELNNKIDELMAQ